MGGWGFPVSDEGSGAWLGCEAVRRVLWAHDGRAPWTGLLRGVFEQFNSDPHAIVRWMSSAKPRDFAALAPLVVQHARQDDPAGRELMRLAAGHIDVLAGRLGAIGVRRLALTGGLSSSIGPWLAGDEAPSGAGRGRCARGCSVARSGRGPVRGADELMRKVIVSMAKECRSDADVTMAREIREAPAAVSRQLQGLAEPLAELVGRLRRRPPQVVVTCARGSSAHAATFGKHLIERYIGVPVAEAAPNIASVYGGDCTSRTSCFSPSRSREGATISSSWPRAPRPPAR